MRPRSGDDQLELFGDPSDPAWSYSRLKSLRRCALEYRARWVDGEQALFQPGHIDVQAGRVLHYIIREYYRSPTTSQPHRLLIEKYEKLAPQTAAWKEDPQGEARTLAALRLFADSRAARFRPISLEVPCKARIGGTLFAGQADLVYEASERPGVYGILEFKLNDVEVRSEEAAEAFLQCIIYYFGLPQEFRKCTEVVGIYVFDVGRLLEYKIDQVVSEQAIRIVETALQRAAGPDFPPTLNPFCSSCGYQTLCPVYSRDRDRR